MASKINEAENGKSTLSPLFSKALDFFSIIWPDIMWRRRGWSSASIIKGLNEEFKLIFLMQNSGQLTMTCMSLFVRNGLGLTSLKLITITNKLYSLYKLIINNSFY